MKIEILESRIAPAGVVTITLTPTDIKLVGDIETNVIELENALVTSFIHVVAASGTQLRFGDQTGTSFDIPLGARKNLLIDLGAGNDELSLTDIQLEGKLEIKGGAGNNTIHLSGLMEEEGIFYYLGGDDDDTITGDVTSFRAASAKFDLKGGTNFMDYTDDACMFGVIGAFTVNGGSGDDTVELHGGNGTFGSLIASLGAGENSYVIELENALITSIVAMYGGGGTDDFSITAANNINIRKTVTADLGDGAGSFEIGAAQNLTIGGKTAVKFGKTLPSPAETVSLKIGANVVRFGELSFQSPHEWFAEATCVVSGYANGGVDAQTPARTIGMTAMNVNGADNVTVNASDTITVRGSIGIKSSTAAGGSGISGKVSLTSSYLDVGGGVSAQFGRGDGTFILAAESVEITGKLALDFGDGESTTEIGVAGGSLRAGSISMVNRTETVDNNETITINGNVAVTGAFTLTDGVGNLNAQFADGSLDAASLTFVLGAGDDQVDLSGDSLTALKLTADLGPGLNTFGASYRESDFDFASIKGGAAADIVTLAADGGLIVAATIDLGTGANSARIESDGGLRIGKLTHKSLSGAAAALDRLSLEGVVVKEIAANFGAADSILAIAASRVGKLTTNLGAGADRVRLDDSTFTGDTMIVTGEGADDIEVENDETHWVGRDAFFGRVTFDLGAGDDDVIIAGAAAETKATFFNSVTVNGGEGTDTFTPHPTNATFISAPVLTSIP